MEYQPALGDRYMKYTAGLVELVLIAQLEYTCQGGDVVRIRSNTSLLTTVDGPYLGSVWYGGEEYIATKKIATWSTPSGNLSHWDNATFTTKRPGMLQGPAYPQLQIVERTPAVLVTGPSGQYVIDFGIDSGGWFALNITEAAGARVTMTVRETL